MKSSYFKSELAVLADVSYSTFYRYLLSRRDILASMGCHVKDQKLRGKALEYVCSDYNIRLPEETPEPVRKHVKFV